MSKLYMINVCKFQRKQNGNWEKGLIFNEGDGLLIDSDGIVVEGEIWDLKQLYGELSIGNLGSILDSSMYNKDEKAIENDVKIYKEEDYHIGTSKTYCKLSNYTL